MKILLCAVALILSGCGFYRGIDVMDLNNCIAACSTNGGLVGFTIDNLIPVSLTTHCRCADGATYNSDEAAGRAGLVKKGVSR